MWKSWGRVVRKIQVFVSYSHEDHSWVAPGPSGLIPWLAKALRRENAEFWYDPALQKLPGEDFKKRILAEIDRSDIACLLVSQDFLISEFIRTVELPRIKERLERNEIGIVPILVGPVLWEGSEEVKWIAERQMLPGRPTPLVDYVADAARWQAVRVEILGAIRHRIAEMQQRPVSGLPADTQEVGDGTDERSATAGKRRAIALVSLVLVAVAAAAILVGRLMRHVPRDGRPGGTETRAAPAPQTGSPPQIAPFTSSFFDVAAKGSGFVYVVDFSGSMYGWGGAKAKAAKAELLRSINALTAAQKFYVIFYDHRSLPMPAESLVAATTENRRTFGEWIEKADGGGGTDPRAALQAALSLKPDAIWLMADGLFEHVTQEEILELIRANNPGARIQINTIAFFDKEGEPILQRIAQENRGKYRFIPPTTMDEPGAARTAPGKRSQ